jgi:hypothetical protein
LYRLGITAPYSEGKENQATNFKGLTQAPSSAETT